MVVILRIAVCPVRQIVTRRPHVGVVEADRLRYGLVGIDGTTELE